MRLCDFADQSTLEKRAETRYDRMCGPAFPLSGLFAFPLQKIEE